MVGSNSGTVTKCYSVCEVSGSSYVGGLLGLTSKDTINSFWNVESSGTTTAYILRTGWSYPYVEGPVYSTPGVAEGKTTAEMMTQSTFTGWDFDPNDGDSSDWWMPSADYPKLCWQPKIVYEGQTSVSLAQHDTGIVQFDVYGLINSPLIWMISGYESCEWITGVDPNSGISSGPTDSTAVTIAIDTSGMGTGDYTCELILSANDSNSVGVPVSLHVYDRVDLEEFSLLAQYWQSTGCVDGQPCAEADWYVDGIIDIKDIAQMATCWMDEGIKYVSPITEDFETGDFTAYPWQHGGDANWSIVSDIVFGGSYAAKSGLISHNQNCSIQVTLDINSENISFYRRVSSETNYDFLRFYIDGVERSSWSGEQDWAQEVFSITPGEHTFKWSYTKDGSASENSDCAWIDAIMLY